MANVLVFLPGFAGSRLKAYPPGWDYGVEVWLGVAGLPLGGYRALDLSGTIPEALGVEVRPTAVLEAIYGEFLDWCRGRWDQVISVAWDWRQHYDGSAPAVAEFLAGLAAEGHSLTLVGHSAGGLLAAAASHIWPGIVSARMRHLVTVGTPWRGSWRAVESLLGLSDVVRLTALLSAVARTRLPWMERRRVREVLSSFPGLYDLFPHPSLLAEVGDPRGRSPWDPGSWTEGECEVNVGHLAAALARTTPLRVPSPGVGHINVIGTGEPTSGPHLAAGDFSGYAPMSSLNGDGVVCVQSATLPAAVGRSEVMIAGSHAHLCSAHGMFGVMLGVL